MVVAIYVLAGLLFVLGLGLVVSAVNLLPTDLGLIYLQGGITFITGAAIILAIAFSTRHNRSRRSRRRAGKRPAPLREDEDEDGMVPASAPPIAAGLSAAAAGTLLAAGGMDGSPPSLNAEMAADDPRTQAVLDAFERDLGAELARLPGESMPEAVMEEEAHPLPPLAAPGSPEAEGYAPPSLPASSASSAALSLPPDEDAEPLMFDLPPLPPMASHTQWGSTADAEYARNPPMPEVPGLLPDEDLVSLAEAEAPLAPLETLEEVGSYESAGTRFTMYSDGSVVTANAEGETRYRTLDDLRAALAAQGGKA